MSETNAMLLMAALASGCATTSYAVSSVPDQECGWFLSNEECRAADALECPVKDLKRFKTTWWWNPFAGINKTTYFRGCGRAAECPSIGACTVLDSSHGGP